MHRNKLFLHIAYTWVIILSSIYMLYGAFKKLNFDYSQELLVAVILVILAEWFAIKLPKGLVSGGFAAILFVFVIYGKEEVAFLVALSILIGHGIANRGNPMRTILFNAAQYVLAVFIASWLYELAGGVYSKTIQLDNVIPLLLFIFGYYISNHFFITLYQLFDKNNYPFVSILDILKWDAYTYLFAVPVGILMVLIYQQIGVMGSALIFMQLIFVQYILRMYVDIELLNREFRVLYRISSKLTEPDLKKFINFVLKEIRNICRYDVGIFYIWENKTKTFNPIVVQGDAKDYTIVYAKKFVDMAVQKQHVTRIDDTRKYEDYLKDGSSKIKLRSVIAIPLFSNTGVVSVVFFGNKLPKSFSKGHERILSIIGYQLSLVISNAIINGCLD